METKIIIKREKVGVEDIKTARILIRIAYSEGISAEVIVVTKADRAKEVEKYIKSIVSDNISDEWYDISVGAIKAVTSATRDITPLLCTIIRSEILTTLLYHSISQEYKDIIYEISPSKLKS